MQMRRVIGQRTARTCVCSTGLHMGSRWPEAPAMGLSGARGLLQVSPESSDTCGQWSYNGETHYMQEGVSKSA